MPLPHRQGFSTTGLRSTRPSGLPHRPGFSGSTLSNGIYQPSENLPSPADVGWNPWETARGAGRWAGEHFMGLLDWLNGFSRIGVQTLAGIDRGFDTGEWDFNLNWWKYETADDAHRALQYAPLTGAIGGALTGALFGGIPGAITGGGIGLGAGTAARMGMDVIPDTPEQAAETFRARGQRMQSSANPLTRLAGQALPLLSGLFNEITLAEMFTDPLTVFEGLGLGGRIASGITRLNKLPVVSRMARAADNTIIGSQLRQAYGWIDRHIIGTTERAVGRLARETVAERTWQYDNMIRDIMDQDRAILEAVGPDEFISVRNKINDIIERLPDELRLDETAVNMAVSEAASSTARYGDISTMPFAYRAQIIAGGNYRFKEIQKIARDNFPDLTETIQDSIAHYMTRQLDTYAQQVSWENLRGIPTRIFEDNQYVLHATTPEFQSALKRAVGNQPLSEFQKSIVNVRATKNILGREATQTLYQRDMRDFITNINPSGEQGLAGFIKGDPELKFFNSVEEIPDNFIPINGKIFIEDPTQLLLARTATGLNAVNAVDFLKESVRKWGLKEGDEIPVTAKRLADIIGGEGGNEFKKTFGRLDENIQELAKNNLFKDADTAQAILRHFKAMRAIDRKPGPILRWLERHRRIWGALTLTPFAPYHSRNYIGGAIANEMEFGPAAILNGIETAIKGKNHEHFETFARMGGFNRGLISDLYKSAEDFAAITPYSGTPVQSLWKKMAYWIAPLEKTPDGLIGRNKYWGRSLGSTIENHQRFTAFIGGKARGLTDEDAFKLATKLHFDYQDVPMWLNNYKGALAFPTWSIKMIPLQVERFFKRPTEFAMRARFAEHSMEAAGITPAETPEFIREGAGFALPSLDPENPLWFRPENFDPATVLSEISDPLKWGYEMLNPLVTEPLEQFSAARRIQIPGRPSEWIRTVPAVTRGAENIGFDPFFDKPIVSPYTEFNENLPLIGGQSMPAWAQRADHIARGFLRAYTELSGTLKSIYSGDQQRISEVVTRRGMGLPFYAQNANEAIYFNLREVEKDLNAELGRSTQRPAVIKELLISKLAILGHGTFARMNPFTGELRHWADTRNPETGMYEVGSKALWQDAIETAWLLMNGTSGPLGASQLVDNPIQLDQSEEEYLEGLLNRMLDTYTIELGNAVWGGEAEYGQSIGYVEDRMEALGR